MRILVTRFPLESALGGAEVQTLSLMRGLQSRGHTIAFLGSCSVLLQQMTALENVQETRLEIGQPPVTMAGVLSFAWRRIGMQKRLIAALESSPLPDAIIMLSLSEKLLLTRWAAAKGIRILWVEHDTVGRWLTSNPWLPALRRLSRLVTTVCVSELSRRIYVEKLKFLPDLVRAIPNGVAQIQPARDASRDRMKNHALHVGCVARLSPEKGVDVLIQAVTDVSQISLTIVGRGRQEGYLRKLIAALEEREGAPCRVRLRFHIDDLAAFYRSLDVLVLPSTENDPFGLVAAEAMTLGVPVIVTDACGISSYLRHDHDAFITHAGSAEELRECLTRLLDASVRAVIGSAGKKTALEKFSLERMVSEYERILKE